MYVNPVAALLAREGREMPRVKHDTDA